MTEAELLKLRTQLKDAKTHAAAERAAADQTVAAMREAGEDLTTAANFDKVDELYKRADSAKDEISGLEARHTRAMEILGGTRAPATRSEARDAEDMASRFRAGAPMQEILRSGALDGGAPIGQTRATEVKTRDEFVNDLRARTTFDNSSNVGSGLLTPDYTGKMLEQFVRRVRLIDVISVGTTDTDTVDWVQEQARTDNAAETAYGTGVPESAYGFAHVQTTVKRVGHFVPATKGILADAGQTRTLLDSRLMTGLLLRIESQIFSGDGTGQNLLGITHASGLGTQALGSDTQLDAVHKAITNVRVNSIMNIEPTVILIHPTDYEKVMLQKTSQGQYIFANPNAGGSPSLWGLTPVVTTLVAAGSPWVGDFKDACQAWVRQGVQLSASDSHASYFIQGLVALLAESRLAYATVRGSSICAITGF